MNVTDSAISLGKIETLPPGQARCYIVGGEEIAVFRHRDGPLFATQNRCPHRQEPSSEGVCGGGKVICPLHGHKFDLASGHGSETQERLKTYRLSECNGDIFLHPA